MTSSDYCLLPPELTVGKVNSSERVNRGRGSQPLSKYAAARVAVKSAGSRESVKFFLNNKFSTGGSGSVAGGAGVALGMNPAAGGISDFDRACGGTTGIAGGPPGKHLSSADSRFSTNVDLPHLGLRLNIPGYKEEYAKKSTSTGIKTAPKQQRKKQENVAPPTSVPTGSAFDTIPKDLVEQESFLKHLRDRVEHRDEKAQQQAALERWQAFCLKHLDQSETEEMIRQVEDEEEGILDCEEDGTIMYKKIFEFFIRHGDEPAKVMLTKLRAERKAVAATDDDENWTKTPAEVEQREGEDRKDPTVSALALDDVPPPSGGMSGPVGSDGRIVLNSARSHKSNNGAPPPSSAPPSKRRPVTTGREGRMIPSSAQRKPRVSTSLSSRRSHLANLIARPSSAEEAIPELDQQQHQPNTSPVRYIGSSSNEDVSSPNEQHKLQVAQHAREVLAACHAHHVQMKHVSVLRAQQRAASATNRLFHRHSTELKAPVLRKRTTREEDGPGLAPNSVPINYGSPTPSRVSSARKAAADSSVARAKIGVSRGK